MEEQQTTTTKSESKAAEGIGILIGIFLVAFSVSAGLAAGYFFIRAVTGS